MRKVRKGFVKKFRYLYLVGVIALGLMTVIATGGGGGDDEEGGGSGDILGYSFTEANMEQAAALGVRPLTLFYPLSQFAALGVQLIEGGMVTVEVAYPLGICAEGDPGVSTLTWTDAGSEGLSAGDSVVLNFDGCDMEGDPEDISMLDGSVTFAVTQYDDTAINLQPYLTARLDIQLTIEETQDTEPVVQILESNFLMRIFRSSTDPAVARWWFRFGGGDEDPNALISITENGSEQIAFGCFDVSVSFLLSDFEEGLYYLGDDDISHVYGVAVTDNKLLTVIGRPPYQYTDLDFSMIMTSPDPVPTAGSGLNYFGFVLSETGDCKAVGVIGGVGQGGDATMSLYPEGDGEVTIELYPDGFGPPPAVTHYDVPWDDLD